MKIIKLLFIFMAILVLAAFAAVYFYMNTIVANQIEKFGSEALNAKVTLGSANVSLSPVGITLNKLSIEKSDKNDPLKRFYAEEIKVSVDINSLNDDVFVINYITINDPEVTYELSGLGLADMAKSVEEDGPLGFVTSGLSKLGSGIKSLYNGKEEPEKKHARSSNNGKKYVIKKLFINGAKITPAGGELLLGKTKEVALPDMEMEYVNETSGDNIIRNVVGAMQKAAVTKLLLMKNGS